MSQLISSTPDPPYVAVIFTSERSSDLEGYADMAARMAALASEQPGYLGFESVDDDTGSISVSYWRTEADGAAWKQVAEHAAAQRMGWERWYADYEVRVATVTRQYGHPQTSRPR